MRCYYCIACGRPTRHLSISQAAVAACVTRTTIYNWLSRSRLHFVIHASGRKYICERSLMAPVFMIGGRAALPADPEELLDVEPPLAVAG